MANEVDKRLRDLESELEKAKGRAGPDTIRLTKESLKGLPEYSLTLPSGTLVGKWWLRRYDGGCQVGTYLPSERPGEIAIRWYQVELVSDGGEWMQAVYEREREADLCARLDAAEASLNQAVYERDKVKAERNVAEAERDSARNLAREMDAAEARLVKERNDIRTRLDAAESERDCLRELLERGVWLAEGEPETCWELWRDHARDAIAPPKTEDTEDSET